MSLQSVFAMDFQLYCKTIKHSFKKSDRLDNLSVDMIGLYVRMLSLFYLLEELGRNNWHILDIL